MGAKVQASVLSSYGNPMRRAAGLLFMVVPNRNSAKAGNFLPALLFETRLFARGTPEVSSTRTVSMSKPSRGKPRPQRDPRPFIPPSSPLIPELQAHWSGGASQEDSMPRVGAFTLQLESGSCGEPTGGTFRRSFHIDIRSKTDHRETIDVLGFSEVPRGGRQPEGRVNNTSGRLDVQTSLIKVGGSRGKVQARSRRPRPASASAPRGYREPTPGSPNSYNNVYYSS